MKFNAVNAFLIFLSVTFSVYCGAAHGKSPSVPYVDRMIVIAVDVSGSISHDEYELQKKGIASAFKDSDIQNMLSQCNADGIAVSYVEWSGAKSGAPVVSQTIPWTKLATAHDMDLLSQDILNTSRSSHGETDIVGALNFSQNLFLSAPFKSETQIVSLSTDGRQGFTVSGITVEQYVQRHRDQLALGGISINAIAVDMQASDRRAAYNSFPVLTPMNRDSADELTKYLEDNVKTGPNSFVAPATDAKTYEEAFKKQISLMINACIS